jgi:hypothetical protein
MIGQKRVRIVYFITVTKYHDRNVGLGLAEDVPVEGTGAM